MINGYQYLINLYKAVLEKSRTIQGRFHVGYRYGLQDINYDELTEILNKDIPVNKLRPADKYPLVMMAPPHSYEDAVGKTEGWEEYRIIIFFCKQSLIENLSPKTRTSEHSIPQDWHDMKRAAVGFRRALIELQRSTRPTTFVVPSNKALYIPFSNIGADRVSGIRLDFNFRVFIGCDDEQAFDYDEYPLKLNIITDEHPEHSSS